MRGLRLWENVVKWAPLGGCQGVWLPPHENFSYVELFSCNLSLILFIVYVSCH